jgi:hypothetical protein
MSYTIFPCFPFSIDQLQKNADLGRYFAVMKRVQDYIQCIPSTSVDNAVAKMHIAVTAWESLCRYKSTQYRIAYKFCFRLRYEVVGAPAEEVKNALSMQIQFAEQCTACQKKLYIVRNWRTRQLNQMKRKSLMEAQSCKAIQRTS